MKIVSNDFSDEEFLDKKFGYRRENISPHLEWKDFPNDTKSFVLMCDDPDAGNWLHWAVVNIPQDISEISQGGPIPGVELKNDFGKKGYGGPAPPSGTHKYSFRIYALDVNKLEDVNKNNFMHKINDHILDSAEIVGLYKS